MGKKKRKSALSGIVFLALLAAGIFVVGEAWLLLRDERGSLALARYAPWSDETQLVRLIGRQIRDALKASGVSPDSVHTLPTHATAAEQPRVRWRVGLGHEASFLQFNHAVTSRLAESGLDVHGRERYAKSGAPELVLTVSKADLETHELVVTQGSDSRVGAPGDVRIALVVFGFGDDTELAGSFTGLGIPFAVALPPGRPISAELFRIARDADREVVLHLPLEPINYPQVNPGPGTILVTMKPAEIAGMVRRYLGQSGPVAAVSNHMGSLATQDMTVMSAIFRELRRQKVPFLHATPAAGSVCKSLAAELGVAYQEPDDVVDLEALSGDQSDMDRRWRQIIEHARARGTAVVMVRATPLSREWLKRALDVRRLQGVSVVPLSTLLRSPAA